MKGKTFTILLVEDNIAHAEIIRRNLSGFKDDLSLNHVVDGHEALDYMYHRAEYNDPLKYPRPGLMLLDLRLPKVDGFEVLKTIKEDRNLSQMPVIVLTSSAGKKDVLRAYKHHANGYLVKPVDFVQSVDLMKAVCTYWITWNLQPG